MIDRDRGAGIALLVPYKNDFAVGRERNWEWLRRFWTHHLPGAEITMGTDEGAEERPFSKTAALNNAFQQCDPGSDIIVLLDADCYIAPHVIVECADRIRTARFWDERLWFVPYRYLYRLTPTATPRLVASDPEHPIQFDVPHNLEDVGGPISLAKIGHRFGALIQIMPREAFIEIGGGDPRFCVDEETQILTRLGWRSRHDLKVGDFVLTLNHDTRLSEWQPTTHVNVFYGQHEMLSIESKTHSSLTTLNHRWPTIRRADYRSKTGWGSKKETREWATSDSFTCESQVPMAAEHAGLPVIETHGDAIVECVAWFWTEGSIDRARNGGRGRTATISQSIVVNPDKCDRIRRALTIAFGEASAFPRRGASQVPDVPRWNEYLDRVRNIVFVLNAESGSLMQQYAPGRVPSCEFLLSLTKAQLDLFIECSLLGDGCRRKKNYDVTLAQKDAAAVDAFQFACILAGHCTSVSLNPTMEAYGYGMSVLRIRQQQRFKLCKGKHARLTLEGVVWCPTTKNSTWLARRNGKVYFTGNSGWGGEDLSLVRALDTLYCRHQWTQNEVLTLWHTALGDQFLRRWVNQVGVGVNNELAIQYRQCLHDPERMQALIGQWLSNPLLAEHRIEPAPEWWFDGTYPDGSI